MDHLCETDIHSFANYGCVILLYQFSDPLIGLEIYIIHIFISSLVWGENLYQHNLDKPE